MKNIPFSFLFILIACGSISSVKGQAVIPAHEKKDTTAKNEWTIGLDVVSRSVFLGRTDSLKSGYFSPNIDFTSKSGIYVALALTQFQQNTAKAYNGLSISAGYDKSFSNNFAFDVSLTKNSSSTSRRVTSTVSFETAAGIEYSNYIFTSNLNFQVLFNKSSVDNTPDYVFTLTESHPFNFYDLLSKHDSLSITPSASISAGTQNFYIAFFNATTLSEHPKRAIKQTQIASEAQVLDYEISLPITYYIHRLFITATPVYSFGENILRTTSPLSIFSIDIGVGCKF